MKKRMKKKIQIHSLNQEHIKEFIIQLAMIVMKILVDITLNFTKI